MMTEVNYNKIFDDFLDLTEFELVKYNDGFGIVDKQGGNLGGIEGDRFTNAGQIFNRMDNYIYDYLVKGIEESVPKQLLQLYRDWEDLVVLAKQWSPSDYEYDINMLDVICSHYDEINLHECTHTRKEYHGKRKQFN